MVRIAFVHPDLGIGGAERLVVDAGLALKSRGHVVHFFTSHHDKSHCFEETRNGSLQVTAVGDWLPRHCFGYFYAFWAYVRMIYVSLYLVFFSSWRMDVVFCDQVSVCIPVLKLSKARIVFYCHFPDLLLTQRKSLLKRIYRAPLDWLEEVTTGKLPTCIWVMGVLVGRWWGASFNSAVILAGRRGNDLMVGIFRASSGEQSWCHSPAGKWSVSLCVTVIIHYITGVLHVSHFRGNSNFMYRDRKVIRDVRLIWSKHLCQLSWIFWEFSQYRPNFQVSHSGHQISWIQKKPLKIQKADFWHFWKELFGNSFPHFCDWISRALLLTLFSLCREGKNDNLIEFNFLVLTSLSSWSAGIQCNEHLIMLTAVSIPSLPIPLGTGWALDRFSLPTMRHLLARGCPGMGHLTI